MSTPRRFDRKQFLTWGLSSSAAVALGCSSDGEPYAQLGPGSAGAPSGGAPAAGAGGASAGSAGTSVAGAPSAGASGASAGSSGGSVGGSSGGGSSGMAGNAGAAAGAGGAPVPDCGTKLRTLVTVNHGHVFEVTLADVMAGVTKVYDTKGTSNHEHWIQLTAADFGKLKNGGTVRKFSCNDGHEHEYIVNCVAGTEPMTTSGLASKWCDAGHKCGESKTELCQELP